MSGDGEHYVFLNLKAASDLNAIEDTFSTNKIALKCESISMSTTKNVMALPLPFAGVATGESTNVALDFGVATKNISLSGIITEQTLKRKFKSHHMKVVDLTNPENEEDVVTITMTANEIAQLIHASVDSSFLQPHQNFSSLTILIPSRVNREYQYHSDLAANLNTDPENLPLIPFTYKTRGYGTKDIFDSSPLQRGLFPSPHTGAGKVADGEQMGITGFVRSFNTTIVPGQPFIEFSLEFEQAYVPFG
tara:strand:- start:731 stop:1477 length:747 start_codon:yes stop_codon:yes gene_type:complete